MTIANFLREYPLGISILVAPKLRTGVALQSFSVQDES
jgi:hypothetical protein